MADKPEAVGAILKPMTVEFDRKLKIAIKEWEVIHEEDQVASPVSAGGHRRSRCTVISAPPLEPDLSPKNSLPAKPK